MFQDIFDPGCILDYSYHFHFRTAFGTKKRINLINLCCQPRPGDEELKNKEFKKEYDALEEEFTLAKRNSSIKKRYEFNPERTG